MQVVCCITYSWTPAGKVTVSWMLRKWFPIGFQECFVMFLPSLSAIPFCTVTASHLAHPYLDFPTVFTCRSQERQSLLPLQVTAWPGVSEVNRQPSSLLRSCTFFYIKVVHAVFAINSEQMNQTVLQSARGNTIFWLSCLQMDLQVRYTLWLLDVALPGTPAAIQ